MFGVLSRIVRNKGILFFYGSGFIMPGIVFPIIFLLPLVQRIHSNVSSKSIAFLLVSICLGLLWSGFFFREYNDWRSKYLAKNGFKAQHFASLAAILVSPLTLTYAVIYILLVSPISSILGVTEFASWYISILISFSCALLIPIVVFLVIFIKLWFSNSFTIKVSNKQQNKSCCTKRGKSFTTILINSKNSKRLRTIQKLFMGYSGFSMRGLALVSREISQNGLFSLGMNSAIIALFLFVLFVVSGVSQSFWWVIVYFTMAYVAVGACLALVETEEMEAAKRLLTRYQISENEIIVSKAIVSSILSTIVGVGVSLLGHICLLLIKICNSYNILTTEFATEFFLEEFYSLLSGIFYSIVTVIISSLLVFTATKTLARFQLKVIGDVKEIFTLIGAVVASLTILCCSLIEVFRMLVSRVSIIKNREFCKRESL